MEVMVVAAPTSETITMAGTATIDLDAVSQAKPNRSICQPAAGKTGLTAINANENSYTSV
jgi:hypothetical protein